ncbi:MAG: nuclear transport factor 2 family protein [Nitrospina sp.]|jgi:uncharacterized protein|nr:nuclear transport factor 2 family protein [Nitrospina sp.]
MGVDSEISYKEFVATTEESRNIVQKAVDALNSGDNEAFISYFADDFEFWMPGSTPVSGSTKGIAEFGELVGQVGDYLDVPIKIKITNFIANGEWVVLEAKGHGVTRNGEDYDNCYCHIWRVVDGKIVRFVEYNDTDLILRVLCK